MTSPVPANCSVVTPDAVIDICRRPVFPAPSEMGNCWAAAAVDIALDRLLLRGRRTLLLRRPTVFRGGIRSERAQVTMTLRSTESNSALWGAGASIPARVYDRPEAIAVMTLAPLLQAPLAVQA